VLRKRLIFVLIYSDGSFCQSRNFRLQKVGKVDWIIDNYKFTQVSKYIDELIILDASPIKDTTTFCKDVKSIIENIRIPKCFGGGVSSFADALEMFEAGADKISINSLAFDDPIACKEIISMYGSQSIVASIDYKSEDGHEIVYKSNGTISTGIEVSQHVNFLNEIGFGEILLNSMDRDGTGFGYDLDKIISISNLSTVPIIALGGAGNKKHFHAGLLVENVGAVATANLFNFMEDALGISRDYLLEEKINLAKW
jgi:imidazole glycerol-phosphate synthase subunit HisF